jgi:hypothetical protein
VVVLSRRSEWTCWTSTRDPENEGFWCVTRHSTTRGVAVPYGRAVESGISIRIYKCGRHHPNVGTELSGSSSMTMLVRAAFKSLCYFSVVPPRPPAQPRMAASERVGMVTVRLKISNWVVEMPYARRGCRATVLFPQPARTRTQPLWVLRLWPRPQPYLIARSLSTSRSRRWQHHHDQLHRCC